MSCFFLHFLSKQKVIGNEQNAGSEDRDAQAMEGLASNSLGLVGNAMKANAKAQAEEKEEEEGLAQSTEVRRRRRKRSSGQSAADAQVYIT